MSRILVIDDEPGIRDVLGGILSDEGYQVSTAEDGIVALEMLKTEIVDVVFLDIWLPNMGGMDVLEEIKSSYPDVVVIIISGHGNIDMAVKAVKMGAFDFLEKPLGLDRVVTAARNAVEHSRLKVENRTLKNSLLNRDEIVGRSPGIARVRHLIDQSARTDARILILGDNGTGKELVAREIHRKSPRSGRPFQEVNCAAIPDSLLESELFGHEKGAFTSAHARRRGKFELAHTGTLFLDEVADMSAAAQAKVLRVIQELKFERVGGEEQLDVDVRLIAATNKDIHQEIQAGRFREDLYYRLNVITIEVPPLRDRQEDIPLLVQYFAERQAGGGEAKQFSPEAMKRLAEFEWPGNIRELKNFVERVSIMVDEAEISVEMVERYLGSSGNSADADPFSEYAGMGLGEARDTFEKRFLLRKLQENQYNISRTAQDLGIYPSNLHGKVKKYGIDTKK